MQSIDRMCGIPYPVASMSQESEHSGLMMEHIVSINNFLKSPIEQTWLLEREKTILQRPRHYFFDQQEEEKANTYIEASHKLGWFVTTTYLNEDMYAENALGHIVETPPLKVDLAEDKKRRSFSMTLVEAGIECDKDILVVLRNLHRLDPRERGRFFDRLESADMKAKGGIREIPDARNIQFVGIGDISALRDEHSMWRLFHTLDEVEPSFDEARAREMLVAFQNAFKQLETVDSVWITSAKGSGKSSIATALRHRFPEKLYMFKLDKLVTKPEEVFHKNWPTKGGQIALFDRAEVLKQNPDAVKVLVDKYKKALFLESADPAPERKAYSFFSV